MDKGSPRMTGRTRETPVNSSPAVAANAEGEEIEVLESTDVLPVAQEDVSLTQHKLTPSAHMMSPFYKYAPGFTVSSELDSDFVKQNIE